MKIFFRGCVLLLVVVVTLCAANAADQPQANPPWQAASQPASQPYPSKALAEACESDAAALRKRLDGNFTVVVSAPFIVAGNMPAERVKAHLEHSIARPAELMWRNYFRVKPDKTITVLLLGTAASYEAWSAKLLNEDVKKLSPYGYYRPDARMMVMNIDTGGGTLVHELTHALIDYDFPQKPDWFNEGLASLHEQCTFIGEQIMGLPNWRLKGLQDAIKAGKLGSLEDLVTTESFYGPQQGIHYAQARYFCQYLQSQGLLAKFYAYLRDHEGDKPSLKAVEQICGKKIADVDQEMVAWVKTLRFP